MADIHALPRRVAGRRRAAQPVASNRSADVIEFTGRSKPPAVTAEQMVLELEEVITEVARGLLASVAAIRAHNRRHGKP